MITARELPAKIAATNRANAEANRIQVLLQDALRPFVGKVVVTAANELIAKVQKVIPHFAADHSKRVFRSRYRSMLVWSVSVSEPVDNHSVTYAESHANIGIIEYQTLTELYPLQNQRTDWTLDEVMRCLGAAAAAKDAYEVAKEQCGPFLER